MVNKTHCAGHFTPLAPTNVEQNGERKLILVFEYNLTLYIRGKNLKCLIPRASCEINKTKDKEHENITILK